MNRRQFFGSVLGARLAAKLRVAEEPKDYWILGEGSLGETTVLRPFKVEMERIVNSESQWIDISRYVEKVTVISRRSASGRRARSPA